VLAYRRFQRAAGAEAGHAGRRDGDRAAGPRIAARPCCPAGDDERPEPADRDRSAVAEAVADTLQEGAQRAGGVALGTGGGARKNLDQVGLGPDGRADAGGVPPDITLATASSNTAGGNGFSITGTCESSRNAHESALAVSPVMNTNRRASSGSCALIARKNVC